MGGGCACRGAHRSGRCAGRGGARRVEVVTEQRVRSLGRRDVRATAEGARAGAEATGAGGGWCALGRSGRTPGRRVCALGQSTLHYRRRGSAIPTPLKSTIPLLHIARHEADSAWICPLCAPRHCLARSGARYAVVRPLLLKLFEITFSEISAGNAKAMIFCIKDHCISLCF